MILSIAGDFEKDLLYWQKTDRKIVQKITSLVDAIIKDPFDGIGKPKPLKYELSGCWSRRINKEHRIVYRVVDNRIQLLSCRYHY